MTPTYGVVAVVETIPETPRRPHANRFMWLADYSGGAEPSRCHLRRESRAAGTVELRHATVGQRHCRPYETIEERVRPVRPAAEFGMELGWPRTRGGP